MGHPKHLILLVEIFILAVSHFTFASAEEPVGSAAPALPRNVSTLTVDVKQRGAIGDGVTDDTASIQSALNGGQRTVIIPAGIYKISAALKLDSQTTIQADAQAIIRLADKAGNDVGLFLLTNRDFTTGNTDITIEGGIWDGNNEHNARGLKEQRPCSTGVAINFINVRRLALRDLTVRNPDSYAIRACHLADFVIENIGFDFSVTRPNQDGVHLNGFCEHGVIRNIRALSPYATNDDMVALNADDAAGEFYVMQQGMVNGPIRDITVEHLRADSAFTFVRLLSHQQSIENVTISDVAGGCRFYAINMDRWRFPEGGGNIRNVTLRDFTVRKMPDDFSRQVNASQRPLIHIQSAVHGLRIENFRRASGDVTAPTLVLDNGQQNQLRLEGLNSAQETELRRLSPTMTPDMFSAAGDAKTDADRTLQMDGRNKVTLPAGSFSLLTLNSKTPAGAADAGRTEVFKASDDWFPITWQPAQIVKGSALDFSAFLDVPAGRFGAAICRDGQFVFKNAPERPVHIYGTVISHALPFIDKQRCEQLTDNLAACGYNGVRLHNYNFAKGVMKEIGSTEFTPEALDQLDYFFFSLKQRGIYYSFPINAWGFFKAGDVKDVPEFRDRGFRFESNGLLPISEDLQHWFKTYALNLLGHVNPYTGLALKDDPALLSIELANEDSPLAVLGQYPELVPIYREKCRRELKTSLGKEPADEEVEKTLPEYVLKVHAKFVQTMTAFLREAGVRQPITDLNFRDNMIYAWPRSQLDYVDIHAYWALYQTLPGQKPSGEVAYRQNWVNPNTIGWSSYLGPVAGRLFGKPYVNTEFNGCYPSPYWIYTGPMEAIIAGSQGWNAVFRCGHGAHAESVLDPAPVRQIGSGANPLILLSERIGALLFAQAEVKPLPVKVPLVVTPEYLLEKLNLMGGPRYPPSYQQLAFQYQIGTIMLDGHEQLDSYPCLVAPVDMKLPESFADRKVLRADATLEARLKELIPANSPPLQLDRSTGVAKITTPRTETFLLPAGVHDVRGGCVSISGNQTSAVAFAGSLDGRSLPESTRVLALYLTDLKNSGTEIERESRDTVIVRKSGTLPLLVRQGKIEMTFRMKDRPLPHVWALKYDGSRALKIEPHRTADGFAFEAQAVTNPETFSAFELDFK